jgi:hypothetical protein
LQRVSAAGLSMSGGVFLGGNRDSASNISIDGSNVQLAHQGETVQKQSPSGIEQVKVESGIMNAEFGFGVSAVNIVTKSGTNQLHGEGYEFLRNDNLDAANFFTNLAGQKNPEYKMNQFGASVGGPVIKNRLHFFANYEGLRVLQRTVSQGPTPPANVRNGDFSTLGRFNSSGQPIAGPIIHNPYQYDPDTGLRAPFPGNRIPVATMDRAMVAYLKYRVVFQHPTKAGRKLRGRIRLSGHTHDSRDAVSGSEYPQSAAGALGIVKYPAAAAIYRLGIHSELDECRMGEVQCGDDQRQGPQVAWFDGVVLVYLFQRYRQRSAWKELDRQYRSSRFR